MKLRYNLTVLLSVLVLLIACPRQVMAQTGEITVSGKILDENGEPVVGAFVFIPGTTKGATADLDGAYTITVPSDAALEFSCVGYRKRAPRVGLLPLPGNDRRAGNIALIALGRTASLEGW